MHQLACGRWFRWLAVSSVVLLGLSLLLGYLGLLIAPLGALAAWLSLLVGTRHLDQQLRLGEARRADFVLLGGAAAAFFAVLRVLLQVPSLYWLYWLALGALLVNAGWLRGLRRRLVVGGLVGLFGLACAVSTRASGLVRAVETGHTAHARLFLWLGADPNLYRRFEPLLMVAVSTDDAETLRLLLDAGADPNARAAEALGRTPVLCEAVGRRRLELVRLLLDRGAIPDLANNWGETALARAARVGDAAAVSLLLQRGADPGRADRAGRRPVDLARAAAHAEVAPLLER